jgi:hypothetical protein
LSGASSSPAGSRAVSSSRSSLPGFAIFTFTSSSPCSTMMLIPPRL